jgi:phosphoribosylanthranilate isomerase
VSPPSSAAPPGPPALPIVKICGVTRPADAQAAAGLGAAIVGVNFWPRSPRCVDRERARAIAAAVRGSARLAGVFVNEDPDRVQEIAEDVGLDFVQLHGDEPVADLARFRGRSIRAIRFESARLSPSSNLFLLQEADLSFLLIDAPAGERYGGTGMPWDWALARPLVARAPAPVLVAGGIRPETARAALAASGAAGVDVASGVESAPGIKDPEKMRRLMEGLSG